MEDLHGIYKDIYILVTKLGFDAAYVESLPPIERYLYILQAREEQKQEKEKEKQPSGNNHPFANVGRPIDTVG